MASGRGPTVALLHCAARRRGAGGPSAHLGRSCARERGAWIVVPKGRPDPLACLGGTLGEYNAVDGAAIRAGRSHRARHRRSGATVDPTVPLASAARSANTTLWTALPSVLADHTVPVTADGESSKNDAIARRPATFASCVHTDGYGTRSSALIRVPEDLHARPEMLVADGPPCTAPFVDVGYRWDR